MENNNGNDGLERLFSAARKSEPYNANLQYGFETRVMTKIKARRDGQGPFFLWAWRLMPAFLSAVLIIGIWTFITEHRQVTDLSSIAGINNEETMLVASLTGE